MTDPFQKKALVHGADQLRAWIVADDEALVVTDVDGAQHDLDYFLVYVTSRREADGTWRIFAGYDPACAEELREEGVSVVPTEFTVTNAEHDRMLRDGVLDEVDGIHVGLALAERVEDLLKGRDPQ